MNDKNFYTSKNFHKVNLLLYLIALMTINNNYHTLWYGIISKTYLDCSRKRLSKNSVANSSSLRIYLSTVLYPLDLTNPLSISQTWLSYIANWFWTIEGFRWRYQIASQNLKPNLRQGVTWIGSTSSIFTFKELWSVIADKRQSCYRQKN